MLDNALLSDLSGRKRNKKGTIDESGIGRNGQGQKIASFDKYDIVWDARGIKINTVDNEVIRDEKGIKIGSIAQNGIVRNAAGVKIGSIDQQSIVRKEKGIKTGSAPGISIKLIAWFYFFKAKNDE